uniref:Uncharacterized protein n=1 Tax=Oryza nivara TaxID=4536 RepID=A0A0E0G9H6_ORYNI
MVESIRPDGVCPASQPLPRHGFGPCCRRKLHAFDSKKKLPALIHYQHEGLRCAGLLLLHHHRPKHHQRPGSNIW